MSEGRRGFGNRRVKGKECFGRTMKGERQNRKSVLRADEAGGRKVAYGQRREGENIGKEKGEKK